MVYKSVVGGLNSLQEITGVQQKERNGSNRRLFAPTRH